MIIPPKHRAKELTDFSISFGGNIIHDTPYANYCGAYFYRTLSMEKQCNVIARSCYFHIRNIGCIRPFLVFRVKNHDFTAYGFTSSVKYTGAKP
jgi:hypothetical protein